MASFMVTQARYISLFGSSAGCMPFFVTRNIHRSENSTEAVLVSNLDMRWPQIEDLPKSLLDAANVVSFPVPLDDFLLSYGHSFPDHT